MKTEINEVVEMIVSSFDDLISINYDIYGNEIFGNFGDKAFKIYYTKGEKGMVAFEAKDEEIAEKIVNILDTAFKQKSICNYQLIDKISMDINDSLHIYEWELLAPKERIKNLMENKAYPEGYHVFNLKVSDLNQVEIINADYINRYGIYKPNILAEIDAYNADAYLVTYLINDFENKYKTTKNKILKKELGYAIDYLIYSTRAFGTDIDLPEIGERVERTPYFREWMIDVMDDEYFSYALDDDVKRLN